jgi:hypothetical protein
MLHALHAASKECAAVRSDTTPTTQLFNDTVGELQEATRRAGRDLPGPPGVHAAAGRARGSRLTANSAVGCGRRREAAPAAAHIASRHQGARCRCGGRRSAGSPCWRAPPPPGRCARDSRPPRTCGGRTRMRIVCGMAGVRRTNTSAPPSARTATSLTARTARLTGIYSSATAAGTRGRTGPMRTAGTRSTACRMGLRRRPRRPRRRASARGRASHPTAR